MAAKIARVFLFSGGYQFLHRGEWSPPVSSKDLCATQALRLGYDCVLEAQSGKVIARQPTSPRKHSPKERR